MSAGREYVDFLQWALPRLRMRWAGFRRVRGQVRKRIARRLDALGLPDLGAYRDFLVRDPEEWRRLDALCRVTVSRFYRDRAVWDRLGRGVLPALVARVHERGDRDLRCWSLGCASGEEPYTIALVWSRDVTAGPELQVVGIDADEAMLERARSASYEASSLRDLPDDLRDRFVRDADRYRLDPAPEVSFECLDVRHGLPAGTVHLVLCRNLVFTYYDEPLQAEVLERIAGRVVPGGVLVVGIHETLPAEQSAFRALEERLGLFQRR